jgi:hypothetical protein
VINDDLTRILQAYDGMVSADQFLKQHQYAQSLATATLIKREDSKVSPNSQQEPQSHKTDTDQEQNEQVNESPNDDQLNEPTNKDTKVEETSTTVEKALIGTESDEEKRRRKAREAAEKSAEMFNIFKRMMVKKKYVLSTIRFEKEYGYSYKRFAKMNTMAKPKQAAATPAPKSRPYTASLFANAVSSEVKLNRPRTATLIQSHASTSPDLTVITPVVNSNQINSCDNPEPGNVFGAGNADFYEPFRLSPTLMAQTWPYEVDFDKPAPAVAASATRSGTAASGKRSGAQSAKSNKNKCYTCKKLPVVGANNQTASETSQPNGVNANGSSTSNAQPKKSTTKAKTQAANGEAKEQQVNAANANSLIKSVDSSGSLVKKVSYNKMIAVFFYRF